jgi:hypothetical protein
VAAGRHRPVRRTRTPPTDRVMAGAAPDPHAAAHWGDSDPLRRSSSRSRRWEERSRSHRSQDLPRWPHPSDARRDRRRAPGQPGRGESRLSSRIRAGEGARTPTPLSRQRILSPRRLPFRHPGLPGAKPIVAGSGGVSLSRNGSTGFAQPTPWRGPGPPCGGKRTPNAYGLPTSVVTLLAAREAVKRALLTVMAVPETRLPASEVTHGVILHGTTPEMKSGS